MRAGRSIASAGCASDRPGVGRVLGAVFGGAGPHPEQGFRTCRGIVRLAGHYGAERVEAAPQLAIEVGAKTYESVKSILDNKLDRRPVAKRATEAAPILHPDIRGPHYYN